MYLIEKYEAAIASGQIVDDANQRAVVLLMDNLAQNLSKPRKRWFTLRHFTNHLSGIYLYGPVGVGKSYLMNLMYQNINISQKLKLHFHQFMQQIDARLRHLQGRRDPLRRIAKELANKVRLLCLDEFMVLDVAHAMILKELLQALFAEGVILFITSNTRPDDLYLHGVQRSRFLPAIALIKSHCQVVWLGTERDYRLGYASQLDTYLFPLTEVNQQRLYHQFMLLEPDCTHNGFIRVQHRNIDYLYRGKHAIWFDFNVLCNMPRSQLDYLEIAERFNTVFLSNIPVMGEDDTVLAILFIQLIDVLYDKQVRLIMSAAVPIVELYQQGEMSTAFKRTVSRLEEMQSVHYK